MKRSTALKNVKQLSDRLIKSKGALYNVRKERNPYLIINAYVFGSIVKGKENPNDIDILIEQKYDKDSPNYGLYIFRVIESCLQRLKKGMHGVRFHDVSIDGEFGDIKKTKVMIYPINKFNGDN